MRLGGLSIVSRSQTLPAQMANGGSHGTAAGALTPPATTEIALRSASVLSLLSGRLGKSLTSGTETPTSGRGRKTGRARQSRLSTQDRMQHSCYELSEQGMNCHTHILQFCA